jgi:phosphatidate phosphatase
LQARIKTSKYGIPKSFFQFLVIVMAAYCALSRISDYKHHWSDVLAGTLLGITVATLTVSQMINCISKKKNFRRVKCKD